MSKPKVKFIAGRDGHWADLGQGCSHFPEMAVIVACCQVLRQHWCLHRGDLQRGPGTAPVMPLLRSCPLVTRHPGDSMRPLIAFDKFFVCLNLPESNFVICTKTRVIHWGQPVRGELIIGVGSMMTELSKNPQPGSKSR